MKLRTTTLVSDSFTAKASIVAAVVLLISAISFKAPLASADKYDEKIAALQKEIESINSQAGELAQKADTLATELAKLNNEKAQLQTQIDLSQAKYDKLVKEIEETTARIKENREVSGELVVNDWMSGRTPLIVTVAGNSNLAKTIDAAANDASAQQDILDKVDEIERLQKKLEKDKQDVEHVLKDQQNQRTLLTQKENEQAALVEQTKGEEAEYRKIADQKNKEIGELERQQQEALRQAMQNIGFNNVPAGVPGGGGYPGLWANAPINTYVDTWGLYSRQCVSYAAWKVWSTGRYVPHFGGMGNANQWPSTVAKYGIKSGSTPVAGSVAMWPIGYYGHVMYVESVNGDGTITVSDYNLEWDGLYRKYTRSAAGLTYIYF